LAGFLVGGTDELLSLTRRPGLLELGGHGIALARHLELGEDGERGGEFFAFDFGVVLHTGEKPLTPVAGSETGGTAEFEAEGFLFFEKAECFLRPFPVLQDQRLVAVAAL